MSNRVAVRVLIFLLTCGLATAGTITQVVAFGDSLSDNGNVFALIGYPPAPYWNGRQSNGPVAVEYMANRLGVPLTDLAFNGATTGVGNIDDGGTATTRASLPGMLGALEDASAAGVLPIDPNAVYVIWGGPNDFLTISGPGDIAPTIALAVQDLDMIAGTLHSMGARRIIVAGMPDLSLTPRVQALDADLPGAALLMHMLSGNFNAALAASLPPTVQFFDTNALFTDVYSNPGKYGFTNVSAPCFDGVSICASPDTYLFWDGIHPTTAAHAILGDAFAQAASVPEPVTWMLILAGLAAIGVVRRRSNRLV